MKSYYKYMFDNVWWPKAKHIGLCCIFVLFVALCCVMALVGTAKYAFAKEINYGNGITYIENSHGSVAHVFRESRYTNCEEHIPNGEQYPKNNYFVLTIENEDDYYFVDDKMFEIWNAYKEVLINKGYDEDRIKGLCATVAPTTPKDDFDGPSMTLEDWYKSKEKGNEEPQQVIKIQTDDNALEDCRDKRNRYEDEKDKCKSELEELKDNATILQNDLYERNEQLNKCRNDYGELNKSCVILPEEYVPVKTYKKELWFTSIAFALFIILVLVVGRWLYRGIKRDFERDKKQAIKNYKNGIWEDGAEEVRKNSKNVKHLLKTT